MALHGISTQHAPVQKAPVRRRKPSHIKTQLYDSDSGEEDHHKEHKKTQRQKKKITQRKDLQKNAVGNLNDKIAGIVAAHAQTGHTPHIVEIQPVTPNDAWRRLQEGNARFASGDLTAFLSNLAEEISPEVRKSLLGGQKPYAIILTCSDSRVSPEMIFDEGLGLLFVIRVAGNVINPHVLGTIEYAVEHLHSLLLLVMGHQFCGAVSAAVTGGHLPGSIPSLVETINPAAEAAKKSGKTEAAHILDHAVGEHAKNMKEEILKKSEIVKSHVDHGTFGVISAVYSLETGLVTEVK